jgi:hypothetical protein
MGSSLLSHFHQPSFNKERRVIRTSTPCIAMPQQLLRAAYSMALRGGWLAAGNRGSTGKPAHAGVQRSVQGVNAPATGLFFAVPGGALVNGNGNCRIDPERRVLFT